MNSNWRSMRLVAAVACVAMIFAACGSSKTRAGHGDDEDVDDRCCRNHVDGGTLTVGAEQEPDCFDWLGRCAASSWGSWMGQYQTIPRVFDPIAQAGRVVDERAQPRARRRADVLGRRRSRRSPTTSTRTPCGRTACRSRAPTSQYTADQQQHGKDIYDRTGYADIDKVDCPTPKTRGRHVQAGQDLRGWQSLFGGGVGILPVAHPEGQGPRRGDEERLHVVGWPVDRQVDEGRQHHPDAERELLGRRSRTSTRSSSSSRPTPRPSSRRSSRTRCEAIYPQPQIDVVDAIKAGHPGRQHRVQRRTRRTSRRCGSTTPRLPFDSKAVRQAFGYAIDRDAIVKQLFGTLGVNDAGELAQPVRGQGLREPERVGRSTSSTSQGRRRS